MNEDPVICYCFAVTREQVREVMERSDGGLDQLIEETQITTKCTACALDLDVFLEDIIVTPAAAARHQAKQDQNGGRGRPIERLDSGFFVCDDAVTTSLRLANYAPMFGTGLGPAAHQWRLWLFNEAGRVVARQNGRIERDAELTIRLAPLAEACSRGWFLLSQLPESEGYYGSLRPQCVLEGRDWVSCYHTQFHSHATRALRRAMAPVRTESGKSDMIVSAINGSNHRTGATIELEGPGGSYRSQAHVTLPANGSRMIAIDELFDDLPDAQVLSLHFKSEQPTRKNLIVQQPGGSWNVDHFPNMQ